MDSTRTVFPRDAVPVARLNANPPRYEILRSRKGQEPDKGVRDHIEGVISYVHTSFQMTLPRPP